MEITLEQVEKLREKANVSYEDARAALERTDGDLLDALVLLEREGKTATPKGGFYSTPPTVEGRVVDDGQGPGPGGKGDWSEGVNNFFEKVGKFFNRAITVGGSNYLDVSQDGRHVLSISILAFVLLLIVAFWIILPLMLVGLFFRYRYHVRGKELGRERVNEVLDKTADAFQNSVE